MAEFEEIKGNLETSFTLLKSCEDYTTQEALDAITVLKKAVFSVKDKEDLCRQVADFLVAQGLVELVIRMVKSLTPASEDGGFKSRQELSKVICYVAVLWKKKICTPIRQNLIKAGLIRALAEDLESYDPNSKSPQQRIRTIDNLFRLQNLVLTPGAVPEYRDQGVIPTLMKYVKAQDKNTQVFSLRVLACIVNEEESQELAAGGCMGAMMNMLRTSAEAEDRKYHFSIKTDEEREFTTTLLTLTEGIVNLSSNDANKTAILFNGGIPVLSSILREEYTDNQQFAAAEALWKMSFLDSVRDIVLGHLQDTDTTALQRIKDMRSSTTPKLRDVSKGLLHQLGLIEIHDETSEEKASETAPSTEEEDCDQEAPHIMLSYQWDHQDRVLQIRDKLRAQGYNVWMDVDKMEGNILMAMANAVEKAEVILMCVSRAYKASANCQTEANYSYKLKKDIIPLMVEKGYDADGWLGALIAMKLYARAYADDVFEKDMKTVIRELGDRGKKV